LQENGSQQGSTLLLLRLLILLAIHPFEPYTLTEKMFAVCPVCIERSFLWCRGSQTMVCWSSEPEANKLKETEEKYASCILLF